MKTADRDKLIIEMHTTLHGANGGGGLVDLLKDHEKRLRRADKLNTIVHTAWGMAVAYLTIFKRGG